MDFSVGFSDFILLYVSIFVKSYRKNRRKMGERIYSSDKADECGGEIVPVCEKISCFTIYTRQNRVRSQKMKNFLPYGLSFAILFERGEFRKLTEPAHLHVARRAVTVFRYDDLRSILRFVFGFVILIAVEEQNDICVLLDRT